MIPIVRDPAVSDRSNPQGVKPFWRRGLAGILDFLTIFLVAGYAIAALTGGSTSTGFNLTGLPAVSLILAILLYFYLGWTKFGGTIWQRILKAR